MASQSTESVPGRKMTPMLRQFVDAKEECPEGSILLFRMGDFYETFFEDARIAARELDITLTSRDKGSDDPIPMAGVPWHSISGYIAKLVSRGFTVAICDQVEDPKQAKGIVRREITQLITPGTVSDLDSLDPSASIYVAYATQNGSGDWLLTMLDLLAGELLCTICSSATLRDEAERRGIRELVCASSDVVALDALWSDTNDGPSRRALADDEARGPDDPAADLTARFGTSQVIGATDELAMAFLPGLCRLLRYAESTQRRKLEHIMAPKLYRSTDGLVIDEATRRNLELTRTLRDAEKYGSLLWHLDRCKTAMGSRRLGQWLCFPLRELVAIERRLDRVEQLKNNRSLRDAVRRGLEGVRDIERLTGRIAVGRATPRDLGMLRDSLHQAPALRAEVLSAGGPVAEAWDRADLCDPLRDELTRALVDEPPLTSTDGGIFARGYEPELDEVIALATEGHGFLHQLEEREREKTGIPNLKVRYNKVFGYYLEVTRAHLERVPPHYVRKQTLVNAERFITEELKSFEDKVVNADERRRNREQALFEALVQKASGFLSPLRDLSRLLADTDAWASLAEVADEHRYVRPELVDEPILQVEQSRHPVLERLLPQGERFVPNDVQLDADGKRLMILTGPNMAGKSTVMRQVALCTVLAHMGCLVPAKRARIGLADRVFTRVGASDNIGRGQSTFMVEMVETSSILRNATRHSLVILDEIGRGTSTFDGVSIAWAVAEHLHDVIGARAMFATHYHEMTELAAERPAIANASVAVEERGDEIVFLRTLVEEPANRSYGIQVGALAGLPEEVVRRAREVLASLESGHREASGGPVPPFFPRHSAARASPQLSLFHTHPCEPSAVGRRLAEADPDAMTPRAALALIYELKSLEHARASLDS